MNTFSVRPRVADLVFQVYGKPLHPELFETLAERRLLREDCELTLRITRSGHVITWRKDSHFLTELADIDQGFSQGHRFLHFRLRGEHTGQWNGPCGLIYQTSFQVETLSPEIFRHVHDEILAERPRAGLFHHFQPNHRLAVAPLASIAVDFRPACILLSTFHTFPEEHTVVKSQSLIEKK